MKVGVAEIRLAEAEEKGAQTVNEIFVPSSLLRLSTTSTSLQVAKLSFDKRRNASWMLLVTVPKLNQQVYRHT
jgi:hypothetical protein